MLNKLLFPKNNLEKSLDASWLRNNVISQNIANVDTPGYKRKEVHFEEFLNSEMKHSRTSNGKSRIQGSGDIKVIEENKNYSYRLDGNNVDIEREMAKMAANSLKYNTLIQRINGQLNKLRTVIRGR